MVVLFQGKPTDRDSEDLRKAAVRNALLKRQKDSFFRLYGSFSEPCQDVAQSPSVLPLLRPSTGDNTSARISAQSGHARLRRPGMMHYLRNVNFSCEHPEQVVPAQRSAPEIQYSQLSSYMQTFQMPEPNLLGQQHSPTRFGSLSSTLPAQGIVPKSVAGGYGQQIHLSLPLLKTTEKWLN